MASNDPIEFVPENRSILIPVAEADFAQFIAGLLGKTQTVVSRRRVTFLLNHDDIENCFYLVDQRVQQQNNASLVQFTVNIFYDDNSSVLLNSIDEFKSYREVRNIASVRTELSWTYLIRFKGSKVPEKQVVELNISTRSYDDRPFTGPHAAGLFEEGSLASQAHRSFNVSVRIQHTARTWATDIESLLTGQIDKWDIRERGIASILAKWGNRISFLVALSFLIIVNYYIYHWVALNHIVAGDISAIVRIGSIDTKLNFIIDNVVNDRFGFKTTKAVVFVIASIIVSGITWGYLNVMSNIPRRSFLLLSDAATRNFNEYKEERKLTIQTFIGSCLVSLSIGVGSNYIFGLLTKLFP